MMEGASDKPGCWVRGKDGNLAFISQAGPNSYKPLIPDPVPSRPGRPKLDPTAGVIGKGELAGEWHVHVEEYNDIDNGTDGKYDIFCRGITVGDNSSQEGALIIGWDHVPHWKGRESDSNPFDAFEPCADCWLHMPPLKQMGTGIYLSEVTEAPQKESFEHVVGQPYKYGFVTWKHSYKIVVTGNTFVGFYIDSQDQSAENGHHEVVCYQQVFRAERILPNAR